MWLCAHDTGALELELTGVCKLPDVGPGKEFKYSRRGAKCLLHAEWEWVHLHLLPQICLFPGTAEREICSKPQHCQEEPIRERGWAVAVGSTSRLVRSINSFHMALSLLKEMPLFNLKEPCYCL